MDTDIRIVTFDKLIALLEKQLGEDESAEEVLERIIAERDELRTEAVAADQMVAALQQSVADTARLGMEQSGRLTNVLHRNGFRECDIAACNCGSWHAGPNLRAEKAETDLEEKVEQARDWTLRVVMKRGVELGMMDYADELITEAKTLTFEQLTAKWGGPTPKISATWPLVLAFSKRMEAKLELNRHKGDREGWLGCKVGDLLARLKQETEELETALRRVPSLGTQNVADEAADVANFAMMIADLAVDLTK